MWFTSTQGDELTKWNEQFQIDFVSVSWAHTIYELYWCSLKQISTFKCDNLWRELTQVLNLFGLHDILFKDQVPLFESGYLTSD